MEIVLYEVFCLHVVVYSVVDRQCCGQCCCVQCYGQCCCVQCCGPCCCGQCCGQCCVQCCGQIGIMGVLCLGEKEPIPSAICPSPFFSAETCYCRKRWFFCVVCLICCVCLFVVEKEPIPCAICLSPFTLLLSEMLLFGSFTVPALFSVLDPVYM